MNAWLILTNFKLLSASSLTPEVLWYFLLCITYTVYERRKKNPPFVFARTASARLSARLFPGRGKVFPRRTREKKRRREVVRRKVRVNKPNSRFRKTEVSTVNIFFARLPLRKGWKLAPNGGESYPGPKFLNFGGFENNRITGKALKQLFSRRKVKAEEEKKSIFSFSLKKKTF